MKIELTLNDDHSITGTMAVKNETFSLTTNDQGPLGVILSTVTGVLLGKLTELGVPETDIWGANISLIKLEDN